jgi:hypothetical protein
MSDALVVIAVWELVMLFVCLKIIQKTSSQQIPNAALKKTPSISAHVVGYTLHQIQ